MRYLAFGLFVWLTACGGPLELTVIAVDVSGDVIVSPNDPGELRVVAKNNGDERIMWGMGSSSCQLGPNVIVDADGRREWIPIDAGRACTEDLGEQGLNPGARRTETVEWGGQILVCGTVVRLP